MNNQTLLRKSLTHLGVIAFGIVVILIFFKPQLEGYALNQHDIEQWKGASQELSYYHEQTGDYALWTNSMFGGMPADQIFVVYPGNLIKEIANEFIKIISLPAGSIILHFLSFYVFACFLRIRPLIALLGALAFSFSSYELIVIQAGHVTKSMATAWLPALLGAFIYSFRTNKWWGIVVCGLLLAFQLSSNHLQISYYFAFVLLFTGIYFLIEAITKGAIRQFVVTSAGMIAVFALAVLVNIGNIMQTLGYSTYTTRGKNDLTLTAEGMKAENQEDGLDEGYITNWSYGVGETFTLVSPYVKGYGSMRFADSPMAEELQTEYDPSVAGPAMEAMAYWGDQPITSGPVYVGVICVLLALLGMFFIEDRVKWPLFIVTLLTIMLAWGKNFMGLTDFFINYIPGYDKFRAVTIILIVAEVTVPVLAVLFLERLVRDRAILKEKRNLFIGVTAGFFLLLVVVKFAGLGDGYSGESERKQIAGYKEMVIGQLQTADPAQIKQQYGVDINNAAQLDAFASQARDSFMESQQSVKEVRSELFNSSMNRSIGFTLVAGLLLALLVFSASDTMKYVTVGGLVLLTMVDMIPVAYNYLGSVETDGGYKFWVDKPLAEYPIAASEADESIMQMELSENPSLKGKIAQAAAEGERKADELEYSGPARSNLVNSYRFSALNANTDYRVFDVNGNFNSTLASYLHKSLGGYHGAKLRNIQNVIDYHISRSNNKVFNMLNVKYFIQKGANGPAARRDSMALGNAWFVKTVESYQTPDDEIRALGNRFELRNTGKGTLLVNGAPKNDARVYGAEKLQYLLPGRDTMNVPLSNGLTEGIEAAWVMDANGVTNLVPAMTLSMDSLQSFQSLVSLKVTNEFKPAEEAVMLASEAAKAGQKSFSGQGSVRLTSYSPDRLTYTAEAQGPQLAVFSEIYYPNGWKAYVDGKETEILKVNYLLRGLKLGNGKHKIEFVYNVPAYHRSNTIGMIASLVFLLAAAALAYFEIKRRRKNDGMIVVEQV
jgi:hypothetical protein